MRAKQQRRLVEENKLPFVIWIKGNELIFEEVLEHIVEETVHAMMKSEANLQRIAGILEDEAVQKVLKPKEDVWFFGEPRGTIMPSTVLSTEIAKEESKSKMLSNCVVENYFGATKRSVNNVIDGDRLKESLKSIAALRACDVSHAVELRKYVDTREPKRKQERVLTKKEIKKGMSSFRAKRIKESVAKRLPWRPAHPSWHPRSMPGSDNSIVRLCTKDDVISLTIFRTTPIFVITTSCCGSIFLTPIPRVPTLFSELWKNGAISQIP